MPNIELKFSGETFAEVVDAALQFAREQSSDKPEPSFVVMDELAQSPVTDTVPDAPASDDPKVVYAHRHDTETTAIAPKQLDLEDAVAASGKFDLPFPTIGTTELIEDDGMITVHPPIAHEETAATDDVNAVEDPDVDSAGVKHDPRIHAENRAKKMDGTWKKKRGVKKETIEAVKSGEAGPAPVVHDTSEAYAHLLHCLSKAVQSGKFDLTQLNNMHQSLGVTNVQQLNGDPEKIAQAVMFIETVVNATSEGGV